MQGWKDYLKGDPAAANALIQEGQPEHDRRSDRAWASKLMNETGMVDGGDAARMGIGIITDERMKKTYDIDGGDEAGRPEQGRPEEDLHHRVRQGSEDHALTRPACRTADRSASRRRPRAGAAHRRRIARAGFFALVGHGVPQAVFDAAFGASKRFFALAEADKKRWHIDDWPIKRGFDPIGWQSLDVGMPPDVKESFYTGNTSYGPNQWPDEALVPGFGAACEAYSQAMQQVARRLMALFAQGLGMAPHAFDGYMRDPTCTPGCCTIRRSQLRRRQGRSAAARTPTGVR